MTERDITVSVPDDATDEEAAAISAAVSAHITDRQRRAAAAAAANHSVEYDDQWTLTARLSSSGNRRIPSAVECSVALRAPDRSRY